MAKKQTFVSTTIPKPPKKTKTFISTHQLDANGKSVEQRFWDKEKTLKKPTLVTGDVALSESEEATKKIKEVTAEIKKSKEKK